MGQAHQPDQPLGSLHENDKGSRETNFDCFDEDSCSEVRGSSSTRADGSCTTKESEGVRFGDGQVIQPVTLTSSSSTPEREAERIAQSASAANAVDRHTNPAVEKAATPPPQAVEQSLQTTSSRQQCLQKRSTTASVRILLQESCHRCQQRPLCSRPSNTHALDFSPVRAGEKGTQPPAKGFLAGYFAKSRLHHLSTWKTSLQDMVSSALREGGVHWEVPTYQKASIASSCTSTLTASLSQSVSKSVLILPVHACRGMSWHRIRTTCCQAGDENRPADNQSSSTSEIASCSYKAREFGVRNGMSLGQAKRLCPHVETIPLRL